MNESRESVAASFDQAKSWIANMFQKVASPFSNQGSQAQEAANCLPSSPTQARHHRSAPELVMFRSDGPCLNWLKETDMRDNPLYTVTNRRQSFHVMLRKISLTTFETKIEEEKTVQLATVEMEVERTVCETVLQHQDLVMSGDSGVYKEAIDTQQEYSTRLNDSTFTKTNEESLTWDQAISELAKNDTTVGDNTLNINHTEEMEQTFSKHYQIFREKLSNTQSEVDVTSNIQAEGRVRSFSYSHRRSCLQKQNIVKQPCEKNDLRVTGHLKLSLQHFQKSRQLRVILLCAKCVLEDNKMIFCKVELTAKNSKQKERSQKVRVDSGTAEFNEQFYMDTQADDLNGYVLRLKLCKVSRVLQRPSKVGEALIKLEELDMNLDTAIWVNMRDMKSSKEVSKDEDLEIVSGNRSIQAEGFRLLEQSEDLYTRSPALSRCRSLPRMSRSGITKI